MIDLAASKVIVPIIVAIITGIVTYLGTRRKSNVDAFKQLIDANEKFRNEVRADLKLAKDENVKLRVTIANLETKVDAQRAEIESLSSEISKYKDLIHEYKSENIELMASLRNCESELKRNSNEPGN